MSIQYSGNAQTSTFTPTTKQNIIDAIGAALLAASWTTYSGGSGTGDWALKSATTPQGYDIVARMKDNGGTCVTFSLESSDGVLVGGNSTTVGGGFLNPAAGVFRIVCCKYQAWIWVTPPTTPARGFVAFGVPFVPSWMTAITTRIGWMQSNGLTDTSTTVALSFRTQVNFPSFGSFSQQAIFNTNIWSQNASITATGGIAVAPASVAQGSSASANYQWESGQAMMIDPVITWGATGIGVVGKFKGFLWDAFVSSDAYTGDSTFTEDSHDWICVTDNNTGGQRGTVCVATS